MVIKRNYFLQKQQAILSIFLLIAPIISSAQVCRGNLPVQFLNNKDGTVTDLLTNRMWKQCSEGMVLDPTTKNCINKASTFSWGAALRQAETINTGGADVNLGYSDWRVPNIKELRSIVKLICEEPALDLDAFPETAPLTFWSSTAHATPALGVWQITFTLGDSSIAKSSSLNTVRLVRDL